MLGLCEIHMQIGPNIIYLIKNFTHIALYICIIYSIAASYSVAICIMTNLGFWSTTFNNGCILINVSTDCMTVLFMYNCSIN